MKTKEKELFMQAFNTCDDATEEEHSKGLKKVFQNHAYKNTKFISQEIDFCKAHDKENP